MESSAPDTLPVPDNMIRMVRDKDWSQTPIGPLESWPNSLRAVVDAILRQPLPAIILWGPDLIQIYNDGYRVIAEGKHPRALGQPTYECWKEIAEEVRPLYERVLAGESFTVEDLPLTLMRSGNPEEVFLTPSYSPLFDDDGAIAGILAIVFETTGRVKTERERARMERDRARMAEQRRLALETAGMGWWHLDVRTNKIYWDERLRAIYGVPQGEMEYPGVLTRLHPEDRERVHFAIQRALNPATSAPYSVEYRFLRPDGSVRWMQSRGIVQFRGEGAERQASAFFGTALDITESKESEAAVRKGAERLNLALAAAHLGIWEWDAETDLMQLSPRAAEIYGIEPGRHSTRTRLRELLHPDYRELARLASERATATRTEYDIEYPLNRTRDGLEVWVAAKGKATFSPEGRLTGMLGVVQDISARKEADRQQELLLTKIDSERARLNAAFQQSPAFMCLLRGPEHVFEFVNEQYEQLIGRRIVLGKPIREALPEIAGQGFFEILDEVYRSGDRFVGKDRTVRIQRASEQPPEERIVDFVYQPILDSRGEVSAIFVHGVDSTDFKHGLQERERLLESERTARAEAERANKMKDDFLSTLSHELRTPLNAIVGWVQVLRMSGGHTGDMAEGLETIERNALAQAKIIEDLLDMSRIISGKVRLEVQRVDLKDVIKSGVETVRPAADSKGVRLSVVIDPYAGPAMGDPNRLQQVVWNLLNNAVKFTPKGGQVQVKLESSNSHLDIHVSDTGIGIAADFLPFVFDRFRQADSSTTRRHGGLGLGLAIVKQLVELHGGTVRVRSGGSERGCVFTVSLPRTAVLPEAAPVAERYNPRAQKISDPEHDALIFLPGIRILVVDDEPDARTLVKKILEECDATVVTASSAVEALEQLLKGTFDVLVSDIGMPEVDGYRLIRRIRKLTPEQGANIPALALTAFARSEDRMRAIRCGFNMHIVKPVERAELITMVASLAGVIQR